MQKIKIYDSQLLPFKWKEISLQQIPDCIAVYQYIVRCLKLVKYFSQPL